MKRSHIFLKDFLVFCLFYFAIITSSLAENHRFQFVLATQMDEANRILAQSYLAEVERLLPSEIKDHIGKQIVVEFKDFHSNLNWDSLLSCSSTRNLVVGESKRLDSAEPKITIDKNVLKLFSLPDAKSRQSCLHQNAWQQSLAVLIHELAHVLDASGSFLMPEAQDKNKCIFTNAAPFELKSYRTCDEAKNSIFRISDSLWYKNTVGLKRKAEYKQFIGVPDLYEYKNIHEHFAVNFEYFILDPQYACKRPLYSSFFQDFFKLPIKSASCILNTRVFDERSAAIFNVDPKRIYQIDYLFAGPGSTLVSTWGHSMFRIILCAPSRIKASAECRADVDYHIVFGIGANVLGGSFNPIQSVVGGYSTQPSFIKFNDLKTEYTEEELRNLTSQPIHFTAAEQTKFIYAILQSYWSSRLKYKLFTINCASEALRILKMALSLEKSVELNSELDSLTPKQLQATLEKIKLITPISFANEKKMYEGDFFPSKEKSLKNALQILEPVAMSFKSLDDFLNSNAKLRFKFYQRATTLQQVAACLYVERWRGLMLQTSLLKLSMKQYAENKDKRDVVQGYTDYGIPDVARMDQILIEVSKNKKQLNHEAEVIFKTYLDANQNMYQEFIDTQKNIRQIQNRLGQLLAG